MLKLQKVYIYRCKCNGHASSCHSIWRNGEVRKVCKCEHDTAGDDCERCDDFYQETPWRRATATDAAICNRKSVHFIVLFLFLLIG